MKQENQTPKSKSEPKPEPKPKPEPLIRKEFVTEAHLLMPVKRLHCHGEDQLISLRQQVEELFEPMFGKNVEVGEYIVLWLESDGQYTVSHEAVDFNANYGSYGDSTCMLPIKQDGNMTPESAYAAIVIWLASQAITNGYTTANKRAFVLNMENPALSSKKGYMAASQTLYMIYCDREDVVKTVAQMSNEDLLGFLGWMYWAIRGSSMDMVVAYNQISEMVVTELTARAKGK